MMYYSIQYVTITIFNMSRNFNLIPFLPVSVILRIDLLFLNLVLKLNLKKFQIIVTQFNEV